MSRLYSKPNNQILPGETQASVFFKVSQGDLCVPLVENFHLILLFSHSVMSSSLQPHGLQHERVPCPSFPALCSNSCPLNWWCYPTISSSVIPFSSCFQSFPELGSIQMSHFFASGGQSIGASASVLPNEYSGLISFKIGWFDLLAIQGTLESLLQHQSLKASILQCPAFFMVQLSHPYILLEKPQLWLYGSLLAK